ncbi:MAG TPA: hypothetical protein VM935_16545 [Chitinophagaceae bacterium]|nr:hypothetical protein [Chitinophagaceae bacterium]
MSNNYTVPEEAIVQAKTFHAKSEALRERMQGSKIKAASVGNGHLRISAHHMQPTTGNQIVIPPGKLALDEDALKKKREELKKKLLEGQKIVIANDGNVSDATENAGNKIQIPPGKLASFYWYDKDPQLLEEEVAAMKHFFQDNFTLDKLEDGRLFWFGTLNTGLLGSNAWHVQLVYDNNHPSNSSYGGSVKVYLVSPDIDDLQKELGVTLPHILADSAKNLYLCTAERDNFYASKKKSTSAASCLSWAVKWIAVCEMFIGGEVTYDEFAKHGKF